MSPCELFPFRTNPVSGSLESHMSHVTYCQLFSPITHYLRVLAEIPTSLSLRGLEASAASFLSLSSLPHIPPLWSLPFRKMLLSESELSGPLEPQIPILITSISPRSMGKNLHLHPILDRIQCGLNHGSWGVILKRIIGNHCPFCPPVSMMT